VMNGTIRTGWMEGASEEINAKISFIAHAATGGL